MAGKSNKGKTKGKGGMNPKNFAPNNSIPDLEAASVENSLGQEQASEQCISSSEKSEAPNAVANGSELLERGEKDPSSKELHGSKLISENGEDTDSSITDKQQNGELQLYPVTVRGPSGEKLELQINPGDSVMDLRQFLLDAPETCFYTCYDLIMVMKDGSRHQLADYFEIGDVGDITTGGCSLEMVTAFYDDRSVRSHVRRTRDLVTTATIHSSLSTAFAMAYEANQHAAGGEGKSEAPELEGLGFMEDPSGLLENLVVSPSSQEVKCVESIAFSSFNPAPGYRRRDVSRAEDAIALPYGTELIGMQRDWNEELQSCREFPRKTLQDRILRDRALYKVSCDFVDAAIKGAKGVISRCIPPINPTDPERFHILAATRTLDLGKKVVARFHQQVLEAAKLLHIKEHEVLDGSGNLVEGQERMKKGIEEAATEGSASQEETPAILLNPNILTDFKLAGNAEEVAADEALVKKVGAYLVNDVLPKFVQDLSSLEVSPMDGQTLTEALHAHGINVRYIGKGVLRETQDHDLGGAIAHFFNCFLSRDAPIGSKSGGGAVGEKSRKKGKGGHSKKAANQLSSAADNTSGLSVGTSAKDTKNPSQGKYMGQNQASYLCITSELVWIDINECVKFKYQYELPEDVKLRVKKISTFRNLCQKVGISIGARKYDLDAEVPFKTSDILDIHAVVKHSATVCSDARDLLETGKLQLAEGKLNEAYELFSEAFTILQQVSGPMHREVANCCRYLAMVLYHAGDMAGAIMQQHKELIINERCLGLDHPDTAHRHMARTLLLLNVSCGSDHPDVAATFINIAMMYQDIGRMNVALRYLQEALKKNERLLGHDHIQTAVCYHALAIAFNCMGAYKLSLQHERSTYNILAKQLGEDDSRTRDSANWIKTFQIRDAQAHAQKQKGQAVDADAAQKAVDALKARPDLIQAFQAATGGSVGGRTSLNKAAAAAALIGDTLPRGRGMDERGARAAAEVRKKAAARGLNVRPQGVPVQALPQLTELLNLINSGVTSKAPPNDPPSTSTQEASIENSSGIENEVENTETRGEESSGNGSMGSIEEKAPLGLGAGLASLDNKKQKLKPNVSAQS